MIRRSLSQVPLVEPRSTSDTPSPVNWTAACRRLRCASSSTIPAVGARPITCGSRPTRKLNPRIVPPDTVNSGISSG